MKPRTQAQARWERAPGRGHAWPWLVPQGEVRRGEALGVARDHAWAVETGFFPRLRRVTPEQAACGHPERTTVAAARPPLTPARGLPFTPHRVAGRQFGSERPQALLARGSLPCLCLGGVAHARAPPTFPGAAADFLAPQVIRNALSAAGAL